MIQRAARRLVEARVKILGALAVFVALGAWALASPVGASPDEDFHVVSVWCGQGVQEGRCEPGPTPDSRLVPNELMRATCYAFHADQSAACQTEPPVEPGMTSTARANFDGLYPPVFYWVNSVFVSGNVSASVIVMRLFNALLYVVLIAAIYLAVPAGLRRPMVLGGLVTAVPLGMFIVPSINPSSWAMLCATTLLVSVLGYLTSDDRRRRIQLGVLAGVSMLVGAGARGDAAIYAVIAIGAAVILTVQRNQAYLRRAILPAALAVIGMITYFSVGQSSHADAANAAQPFSLSRLITVALDVPALWVGGLGAWGLGWLDTTMKPIVWVSSWSVFAAVVFLALARAGSRRAIATAAVAAAALVIPTYVQFLTGYPVGSIVQPRYVLPLLTILAVTAMIRLDGQAFQLSNGQRWVIVGLLSIANAVALHGNIRRYVTGTDGVGINLNDGAEWWWSGFVPPLWVWIVGALAFAAGAILLTREMTTAATARDVAATVDAVAVPPSPGPTDLGVPVGARLIKQNGLHRAR